MKDVRPAILDDAQAIASLLNETFGSQSVPQPFHAADVVPDYLQNVHQVSCYVAVAQGVPVGFQSLKIAGEGNPFDVPSGWGAIGTYVARGCQRSGVGRGLFVETLREAERAGIRQIDATIFKANAAGRAYYAAMGFQPYAQMERAVRTSLAITG